MYQQEFYVVNNYKLFFVLLLSIHCRQIQADNVLDLIESNNQILSSPPTLFEDCHLTQLQLKPLLETNLAAASVADDNHSYSLETKYILIKQGSTKNSFVGDLRQTIVPLGFKVCTIDPDADGLVQSNITIVVQRGHQAPYYGRHDPNTLIRFISTIEQRLAQSPYQTIESKLDKKAYEHVLDPKIVAYFPDVTAPGFQEFQRAARMMSPNPPFYVVHNPQFAAKFRLNQPGQISLVRRLEKSQIFFPSSPSTTDTVQMIPKAEEIIDWINKNRGLILHELKDFNLYDPELQDLNKYQLVAVGDKASPLGLYFFKILTKTIQNISRENEMKLNPMVNFDDNDDEEVPVKPDFIGEPGCAECNDQLVRLDDIEIVWIDSSQFPNAALNMKNRYQIPSLKNVWFGLIHAPSNASVVKGLQSVWFGMDTLNLTRSDRKTDEENIQLVRDWILTVTDRKPDPESNPMDEISSNIFELEPEPVSVRKGGNFLLECKVTVGNSCRWQKDSQPITVDGARIRLVQPPPPTTTTTINNHDCSIMISGADEMIDAGQWTCVAVGQNGGQPIATRSVMVTVRDSQNKSEL